MISPDDRPHRLTVTGIYELPFGKGKALLGDTNSVVSRIVSGWQISAVYAYQSGPPLGNWGNITFNGNLGDIRLPRSQQTVVQWINTDAFEKGSGNQLASNVRTFPMRFGFLRADYINNYDLSAFKNTKISEKVTLQFRAEFLNAFNTPLLFTSQINLNPTGPISTPNRKQGDFGSVTAGTQENYARRIQFAMKLLF
jgi:hypothetical protein